MSLEDIRSRSFVEAMTIIGALLAYAGYVLAFVGARSIKV
jgi:hypothetical protein